MSNEKRAEHNPKSSKTMSIVYIVVIMLCVVILAVMIAFSGMQISKNAALKLKENEIIQKYEDLAKQSENFKDEDYAQIYFDDQNIYIPSKDIIIEFQP
jgi:hypothetical protein